MDIKLQKVLEGHLGTLQHFQLSLFTLSVVL